MNKKLKVIDLFSGCGGFSCGFEKAGYQLVLGVDNDEPALETFRMNHKNSETMTVDLHTDKAISAIAEKVKGQQIDVIIAGPPCQGFSVTGQRIEADERNKLLAIIYLTHLNVKV